MKNLRQYISNINKFIHECNLNENKTNSRENSFSEAMCLLEYYFRDNNTNKGGQPVKIGPGHKPRLLRGTLYTELRPEIKKYSRRPHPIAAPYRKSR